MVPQSPTTPADNARAVIAEVFNPRTFRIVRFAQEFQLPDTPPGSPVFHASAVYQGISLLSSFSSAKLASNRSPNSGHANEKSPKAN
jgi:hypothetical protein